MHTSIKFPWGEQGQLELTLPERWQWEGVIQAPDLDNLDAPDRLFQKALSNPVQSEPLRSMDLAGKKIVVVVDDLTRPTPVPFLFPQILIELQEAGAALEEITVLIALGMHRAMNESEIRKRLGVKQLSPFKVINHACRDATNLTNLGRTPGGLSVILNSHLMMADLIVLIGTVEPHLLAGFGGGLKNIIPGCAGAETIAGTHLRGDAEMRFTGVGKMGEVCFTRRELEAGALMVPGKYFLVNTVLTPTGEIAGIMCGHPVKAHRLLCELAIQVYGAPVNERYDVLLLNSHPMDIDLRQGTKCLGNCLAAAKEDALLIALLYCQSGVGDLAVPDPYLSFDITRRKLQEIGAVNFVARRRAAQSNMDNDGQYMQEFFGEMARRHHILVFSPHLDPGLGKRFGYFEQYPDLETLLKQAEKLAPGFRKVASLPYGGTHYPIYAKQ